MQEKDPEIYDRWLRMQELVKSAKKFLLDVKLVQPHFDSFIAENIETYDDFVLPFKECFLAFDLPLKVSWINMNINLYGVLLKEVPREFGMTFVAYLFFQTTQEKDPFIEPFEVAHDYFEFGVIKGSTNKVEAIALAEHHCIDKLTCMVEDLNKNSDYWKNQSEKFYACQQVLNTEAFIESLFYVLDRIHNSQPILVEKKTNRNPANADKLRPTMPFGWPFTKGNLPKDNYTQYLDGKHYVYDKDDIAYGTGVKHRYRYDVRRHPRVVNGKLIWVDYHQRGAGKYIPKVYANRKTWFVNYIWSKAEQLSKYRIFEILMIKAINFLKRK